MRCYIDESIAYDKAQVALSAQNNTIETQVSIAFLVLVDNTGRSSVSSSTCSIPSRIEPPVSPPLKFSASSPDILTSNERMITSLSFEVKSHIGMGMSWQMYSHTHVHIAFEHDQDENNWDVTSDHSGRKLPNLLVLSHSGIVRNMMLVLQNDDTL